MQNKTCTYISRRLPYDEVIDLFDKQGLWLISDKYENYNDKLEFVCYKNGHFGKMSVSSVRKNSCAECAGNKKYTFDDAKNILKEKSFTLISDEYINNCSKLDMLCKNNHEMSTSLSNIMVGYGCITYAGLKKYTIEEVRESFEKEGYTLLSTEYVNASCHLDFICSKGHVHKIAYTHFLSGQGCGICKESRGERAITKILADDEKIASFVREKRFNDCRNKLPLPFDFYVTLKNGKKFLIEFDGEQHFVPSPKINGSFITNPQQNLEKIQNNDIIKTNYCNSNKISLLRISYNDIGNANKFLEDFIKKVNSDKQHLIQFSDSRKYSHLKII